MRIEACVVFALLAHAGLWAQTTSVSQVSGTVRDPNGLAIVGATVRITQTGTGFSRTAVTRDTGAYELLQLPAGPYELRVTKESFTTYVQSGIVLEVNLTCGGAPCSTIANTNQRRYLYLLNPVNGVGYGPIYQTDDGGNGWYNAMLLAVQHRFSQHYTFMANYTWSHCISEADTGGDLGQASAMVMNPHNLRQDLGNCGSDRRQMFNSSVIAQTPQFASSLLRRVATGWQASAIFTAQTGAWVSALTGGDTSLTASAGAATILVDRPDVVGNWHGNGTRGDWFNRAAFVNNAPGIYGDTGRATLLQPGTWDIDAALIRRLRVREGQSVEIRAEAFNLVNHPNLGPAGTTLNSSTFGHITTSGSPRICEFALKYIF